MTPAPIIARLWDYGWLCHDTVNLPQCSSHSRLVEHYISSPAFYTSFIPSEKDETGIHGPFVAAKIHASDFVSLEQVHVEDYIRGIEIAEAPEENAAAQNEILPHLNSAFERCGTSYVLRRDERDKELFDDWGFVLFLFREFLFPNPSRTGFERFVIGYD